MFSMMMRRSQSSFIILKTCVLWFLISINIRYSIAFSVVGSSVARYLFTVESNDYRQHNKIITLKNHNGGNIHSYSHSQQQIKSKHIPSLLQRFNSKNSSENEQSLDERIYQILLDLSFESNDEIRRKSLASVLNTNISSNTDKDEARQFAQNVNSILIEMGTEVQNSIKPPEAPVDETNGENSNSDSDALPSAPNPELVKVQMQLWALVDMMVQSKTFIRKWTDSNPI